MGTTATCGIAPRARACDLGGVARSPSTTPGRGSVAYRPPMAIRNAPLAEMLGRARSVSPKQAQRILLPNDDESEGAEAGIFAAGDLDLLQRPCVAIVGTRNVSPEGAKRARRLARELAEQGVVVVSGLAKGVDTEALTAALDAGGRVVAVIGTALDRAYPAENKRLQERIYSEHLLLSQFRPGDAVHPRNFPQRNKLMAAVADATVIIEASDTSGTLHQASECLRLGRWLFVANSITEDRRLTWPARFVGKEHVEVLSASAQVIERIRGR